jgi:hypothetical protein
MQKEKNKQRYEVISLHDTSNYYIHYQLVHCLSNPRYLVVPYTMNISRFSQSFLFQLFNK